MMRECMEFVNRYICPTYRNSWGPYYEEPTEDVYFYDNSFVLGEDLYYLINSGPGTTMGTTVMTGLTPGQLSNLKSRIDYAVTYEGVEHVFVFTHGPIVDTTIDDGPWGYNRYEKSRGMNYYPII